VQITHITRRLEFDAGHRVYGHEGKCNHVHGHRYVVLITVRAPQLDSIGRVVDFSVIKSILGSWIDDNLDHQMLLNPEDPLVCVWRDNPGLFGKPPYQMPIDLANPTAENIAELIRRVANEKLPSNLTVTEIEVFETPNCSAKVYQV
jgi:6-pyruvoyltetrahydropterin/6-carboxytetrahydropterin synthase